MKKKTYWLIEDNGDLSIYVQNLIEAKEIMEAEFEALKDHLPINEIQFSLTPVEMTEEEFNNLPEFNG